MEVWALVGPAQVALVARRLAARAGPQLLKGAPEARAARAVVPRRWFPMAEPEEGAVQPSQLLKGGPEALAARAVPHRRVQMVEPAALAARAVPRRRFPMAEPAALAVRGERVVARRSHALPTSPALPADTVFQSASSATRAPLPSARKSVVQRYAEHLVVLGAVAEW